MELLTPAGDSEAGYAALHYGADAVYLGLRRFSARASAVNFTPEALGELVAWAHGLTPRRRVYATVNTLVAERELGGLVETLATLSDLEVDAVIVQDLGVARIVRRCLPELALHASTQLAVHDAAGARRVRSLGFSRVTLARELTFEEVRGITADAGIETEVFIHGALCYAYSGLCLFSSLLRGASGNRGRCAYPCRDAFHFAGGRGGLPFSMKDLALGEKVLELADAGVACAKIEGRKKNALYVAAVTRYYRAILDGSLGPDARDAMAGDVQSIFSRPWTDLYFDGRGSGDEVDQDTAGHRGVRIGTVEAVRLLAPAGTWVCFTTSRALERHDGMQIDVPGQERPFGFPVLELRVWDGAVTRSVCAAPAQARVAVRLPDGYPRIPEGAAVSCASSQAVKRAYRYERPRPGAFAVKRPIEVTLRVDGGSIGAEVEAPPRFPGDATACATRVLEGQFTAARRADAFGAAAAAAFDKLGGTRFGPATVAIENPEARFVPVSVLNRLRREVVDALTDGIAMASVARTARVLDDVYALGPAPAAAPEQAAWSLKTDRWAHVAAFTEEDWARCDELVIALGTEAAPDLTAGVRALADVLGWARLRVALPVIARAWEREALREAIAALAALGVTRWQIANVSGWEYLGLDARGGGVCGLDVTADWPLYAWNGASAAELLDGGLTGFTLSPEDTVANMCAVLRRAGERACVVVYQDTPLFISESCPRVHREAGCPGPRRCTLEEDALTSRAGEEVIVVRRGCRAVTLHRKPLCLAGHLDALRTAGARRLRVDLAWRRYTPGAARAIWRTMRGGGVVPDTTTGNAVGRAAL